MSRNHETSRFPSWRMDDGHRIPIRTMSDRHLVNTLRMLARQASEEALALYPMFQGEMAQWVAEQAWDQAYAETSVPQHPRYADLVKEAQRRELVW